MIVIIQSMKIEAYGFIFVCCVCYIAAIIIITSTHKVKGKDI